MGIITYIIITLLILLAVYSGSEILLGSIGTESSLGQIQWLLYLVIFTGSIGFLGMLIQPFIKVSSNKNNDK